MQFENQLCLAVEMVWVGGKGFVTSFSELPNVRTKATTHSVVFSSRLFSFIYLYLYLSPAVHKWETKGC